MKHLYFYEINNSKFYAYIFNINSLKEFDEMFDILKKEHKRATHFIYCYKIFSNNQYLFKRNDDIEPKGYGTNGIINIIEKNNLNNISFVVIRYFGGKKLGGSKLIQSYNKVVNQAYKEFINNK